MVVDSLIGAAKVCDCVFQRALMALHHRPVFADKNLKVIICALCFIPCGILLFIGLRKSRVLLTI